jgi:hypothetical protein
VDKVQKTSRQDDEYVVGEFASTIWRDRSYILLCKERRLHIELDRLVATDAGGRNGERQCFPGASKEGGTEGNRYRERGHSSDIDHIVTEVVGL